MVVEPRGKELISRYKANYNIPADALLTEAMILKHWELEKRLRQQLLTSRPENRWEVFEKCYSNLYAELAWLNEWSTEPRQTDEASFALWRDLIGPPRKKVFEIGSGKGTLITYLAQQGYECRATEITRERGKKWSTDHPNLSWGITDGIHLSQFEPRETYDVVISDQVVEHMHPDDVLEHLKGVHAILKKSGRYIFATPHAASGPTDVTCVFKQPDVMAMHLKEYTFGEFEPLLKQAGFTPYGVLRLPQKVRRLLGGVKPSPSRLYLKYLMVLERILCAIPSHSARTKVTDMAKIMLFSSNLLILARKD